MFPGIKVSYICGLFSKETTTVDKTLQMTQGKTFPLILKFTLPLMLGNILQQTYSLIDAAIVGRMIGVNGLAAVGASVSVIFLILGFCQGCCCGFAIPVAQKFGANDLSAVRKNIETGLRLSLYLSIGIALITSILCRKILEVMQTPDDIFQPSYYYLLITFISIPFTFFYNLFSYWLRALGDSKTPFKFLLLATIINIILDIFFIGALGTGVGGAAIATMIAQAVSAILCYRYIRRHFKELDASPSEKRYQPRIARTLLGLGVPIGLQFSITAIGCIILQAANNVLGASAVAAFAAASRIKMFFFCPLESLGVAMTTFAGQNYGAMKVERISQGMKSAIWMLLIYSVAAFILIYAGSDLMARMFVEKSETDVIEKTSLYLVITTAFFPLLGLLCALRYTIQGVGYTAFSMLAGVFEMVARAAVGMFAVPLWGYTAVCYGDPMAWIAANIFLVPAYIYVYRKIKSRIAASLISSNTASSSR